jgi:sorbitol-specific phosphotransferase system component IIA
MRLETTPNGKQVLIVDLSTAPDLKELGHVVMAVKDWLNLPLPAEIIAGGPGGFQDAPTPCRWVVVFPAKGDS